MQIKLPEPVLYEVEGSYELVVCTEINIRDIQRQISLRGKRYNYENGELNDCGLCEVVLGTTENLIIGIDDNGNYFE
ncbi:hypothetical protein PACILC2_21110 [Paenibacillus cisolokensis]|uniref:Uncharacterized protein n=1 Tax=Paenibacillus cisolokensis TaxID=1658519 RepID=A0ABQ4N5S0_9BACL|nr:hypothetical protein [Paenibacillus cisolokensis]GIQ63543.1 hypothetical protein PACILC2_21110 [Paenibacillus cisolokensis]